MRRIQLLAVEDNYADIHWLKMILDRMGTGLRAPGRFTDGEKAVDFLFKRNAFSKAPDPDLILLDLNLPKIGGIDVLRLSNCRSVPSPEVSVSVIISKSISESAASPTW